MALPPALQASPAETFGRPLPIHLVSLQTALKCLTNTAVSCWEICLLLYICTSHKPKQKMGEMFNPERSQIFRKSHDDLNHHKKENGLWSRHCELPGIPSVQRGVRSTDPGLRWQTAHSLEEGARGVVTCDPHLGPHSFCLKAPPNLGELNVYSSF